VIGSSAWRKPAEKVLLLKPLLVNFKDKVSRIFNVVMTSLVKRAVLTDCVTSVQSITPCCKLQVNSSKYQQCNNSPFLQEPLLSDLGYCGDTPISTNILDGTYVPPLNIDPYAALLLNHMQRPPSMSPHTSIPDTVSTQEHYGLACVEILS
jgi:hypothetical protein